MFPVCVDPYSYNHRHLLFLRISPRYKCRHRRRTLSKLSARASRFPLPTTTANTKKFLIRRGLCQSLALHVRTDFANAAPLSPGSKRCRQQTRPQYLVLDVGRVFASDLMSLYNLPPATSSGGPPQSELVRLARVVAVYLPADAADAASSAGVSTVIDTTRPDGAARPPAPVPQASVAAPAPKPQLPLASPGKRRLDDARRPLPRPRAGPGGLHFCRRRSAVPRAVAN